jgi:hypothetical protein
MSDDINLRENNQNSSSPQKDQRKVDIKVDLLTRLVFIICVSIVSFVGIKFISCNFMIPGTITSANVLGGLKNPPPLDCEESDKKSYDTLMALLATIIALKAKLND